MWLYGQKPLKVSHHPSSFCGHEHCGSGNIMFSVCYVILQDCATSLFQMIPQFPGQNHKNVKRIKHCYNSSGYPQGWSRPYHFKFLKAVFHKFYFVHSWIPWPIYFCRRLRALFVSRVFDEFSLKPLCPTMTGKYFQIYNFQITGHLDLPVKKLKVHFSHGHSFPGPYHHSPEGNYPFLLAAFF